MNNLIRNDISAYIAINGPSDSRKVIDIMANRFSTSKQRISGNISFMVCKASTLHIIRNYPNSIIY